MERTHEGMTMAQRRALQFWIDVHGWGERYVELNGELPVPEYRWEDELQAQDVERHVQRLPCVDMQLDPPAEQEARERTAIEGIDVACHRTEEDPS